MSACMCIFFLPFTSLSLSPFLSTPSPPLCVIPPPTMILHPHQPRGLEVSIQETLIKQISLSLRQAALCLCKGTGSFPLGVWWALRRGGAADFSRFSDWKMTDSKEVYPSWVIASWHPWTSSGFRLSPLGGSAEARQRLGHSIPGKGGSKLAVWGSCPSPQTALLWACDSGFLNRESRYLVSPFPLARCSCGPLTGLGSPSIFTRQLPHSVLFGKGGGTSRKC